MNPKVATATPAVVRTPEVEAVNPNAAAAAPVTGRRADNALCGPREAEGGYGCADNSRDA